MHTMPEAPDMSGFTRQSMHDPSRSAENLAGLAVGDTTHLLSLASAASAWLSVVAWLDRTIAKLGAACTVDLSPPKAARAPSLSSP